MRPGRERGYVRAVAGTAGTSEGVQSADWD